MKQKLAEASELYNVLRCFTRNSTCFRVYFSLVYIFEFTPNLVLEYAPNCQCSGGVLQHGWIGVGEG
ncbi:hypothetical protein MPTK1_7g00580 [Marchantia polymorpha subsp. ruderalis]|uniref:Uncharacterized protein n=2 Tax=Marchantia polymorpha TaxID=3197 RepID=A0AAF6BUS9_MARPO|nr:hypothetical protein MARPO_0046s0067 [Marchantia polymorpha]BBN15763.1 hypothetical protein Mp_7g00580 [Marchantia polymorpha subsp. ruderalis]|eukprot:PTQ39245.1 hypothetical protein MARPO_0046s0067 [Marchantia polymorpha]